MKRINAFRSFFIGITWSVLINPGFPQSATPVDQAVSNWGLSLSDFRASKRSKPTYTVDQMNARALDCLFMDFHEVNKNDPARCPKFSAQTFPGSKSIYFFMMINYSLLLPPLLDRKWPISKPS
jgi:hypothetical protein